MRARIAKVYILKAKTDMIHGLALDDSQYVTSIYSSDFVLESHSWSARGKKPHGPEQRKIEMILLIQPVLNIT